MSPTERIFEIQQLVASALLTCILLGIQGCVTQHAELPPPQDLVFPGAHWERVADPTDAGWSAELLAEARELSEEIGSAAVMIVQGGRIIDEWGDTKKKYQCHSIRKSLLSALIGIEVERGNIDLGMTLDELGIDDNPPVLSEAERRATVGDLIRARSGVYHPAHYESPEMIASRPLRGSHAPGSYWYYNNWDFNVLGTIFEQTSQSTIYEEFDRQIAKPIRMEDFEVTDFAYVGGTKSIHPAYPFRMSSRDLARFGLLYLAGGRWENRQLVPKSWVIESTARHSWVGLDLGYGYMWWNAPRGGGLPGMSLDGYSFAASGNRGHLVIIMPFANLVVVHRVDTDRPEIRATNPELGALLRLILAAAGEMDLDAVPPVYVRTRGFDNVPLPHDLNVIPPAEQLPPDHAGFSGKWGGVWLGQRRTVLVVEKIDTDLSVVVYAFSGEGSADPADGGWTRLPARIRQGELQLNFMWPATAKFRLLPDGRLAATYRTKHETFHTRFDRLE